MLTDRYELTMLAAALADGTADRDCVFEVFARRLPHGRRYGVLAGTGRLLDELADFRFGEAELDAVRAQGIEDPRLLEFLADFRFSGDIDGYAEGDYYFPGSPVLTVRGPFGEAVLLETLALSVLNHDSAIAAAGARMVGAACGRPCIEMGSRRTHEEAAVAAARAAALVGFSATSNLAAGARYGIPTTGTSAHAFTLLHDDEAGAFRAQLHALGVDTTLLVDTYDTEQGIRTAVEVAGPELGAIRLDSGDLDRRPDALVDVEGVDEQRRPRPQGGHLGAEGGFLVVVQQGERVRAGARRRDAVAPAGREVGAGCEADQVRGAGRGDCGLLVRAPGAHLDARPVAGRADHAGGGRGDRAVVVEHRQGEGLQQHPLGEGRPHGEHR